MNTRVKAHALASDKLFSAITKIRHSIVINTTVKKKKKKIWLINLLCLMPLSAIFQLYHGDQF